MGPSWGLEASAGSRQSASTVHGTREAVRLKSISRVAGTVEGVGRVGTYLLAVGDTQSTLIDGCSVFTGRARASRRAGALVIVVALPNARADLSITASWTRRNQARDCDASLFVAQFSVPAFVAIFHQTQTHSVDIWRRSEGLAIYAISLTISALNIQYKHRVH
jgi:hypothetical protein